MPKVLSYEDKNFNQKKDIFSALAQCFADLKYEQKSAHQWNLPADKLNSMDLRLVDDQHLTIRYYRVEVGTVETVRRSSEDGQKFVKEIEKELKKRFKKMTGKVLKLKKVKDDQDLEKMSRLQSDTSWMLGSSRYGYGARPVGRFLVKDSALYSFDCEL